jgi:hypothetical protein
MGSGSGRGLRMKNRDDMLVWISVVWFATLCGVAIWYYFGA